jgi:predicted HTH transcriptional regulator
LGGKVPWLEYFVDGLRSQMEEIQEKGKKIIVSEKLVKGLANHNLNLRQEKIVRFLVINERIDNDQCQKLCGSIRRTATRDLASLVEKGLLVMKGELKGAYYVLSPAVKI